MASLPNRVSSPAQRARAAHPVLPTVAATVSLRDKGTYWTGRCPWHGDRGRPNLAVFPATDTWHCFVCGAHGDGLDWLARLQGTTVPSVIRGQRNQAAVPPVPPATVRPQTVDPDARHHAYTALLRVSRLSTAHRAWLTARRMDPDRAYRRGYVSLRPGGSPVDPGADGVPGFYRIGRTWQIAGPTGLAIPVRDPDGRIQGLHLHADDPRHGKYRWFSSPNRSGGASSGAPVHITPDLGGPRTVLWITEGPLKADVVARALRVRTLGIPGVSVWRRAIDVLRRCAPATVVLAFDQDPLPTTAAVVSAQAQALASACAAQGWRVEYAHWNPLHKGIDDALRAGAAVHVDGGRIAPPAAHVSLPDQRGLCTKLSARA